MVIVLAFQICILLMGFFASFSKGTQQYESWHEFPIGLLYKDVSSLDTKWRILASCPNSHYIGTLSQYIGTLRGGGGRRKRLPKFKFSAKFPIGLHVILQIQIKKIRKWLLYYVKNYFNRKSVEVQRWTSLEIMLRPKKKKKELCLSFLKVKTLSAMRFFFFFFFFSQKGLRGCGNTP